MRHVGFILVVVGVGLASAYGARNPAEVQGRQATEGKGALLSAAQDGAHEAYCEAREEKKLPFLDGCVDPDAEKSDEKAREPKKEPTPDEVLAAERAELATLRSSTEALPEDLAKLRAEWLKAFEAAIEPRAEAARLGDSVKGTERLSAWFGESGLLTLVGLVLIGFGGVTARKARLAEAAEGAPAKSAATARAPVDFSALLRELHGDVLRIRSEMNPEESPAESEFEDLKDQVETLQYDKVELLIDSGPRVQVRFGMAGFAAIFGPLSGGERGLNRAWSAAVDHHWPEACRSFDFAGAQLQLAIDELDRQLAA